MKRRNKVWIQIIMYVILAVSVAMGVVGLLCALYMSEHGLYRIQGQKEFQTKFLEEQAESHMYYICYDENAYPTLKDIEEQLWRENRFYGVTYTITKLNAGQAVAGEGDREGSICFDNRNGETEENSLVYTAVFGRTRQLGNQVQEDEYVLSLFLPTAAPGDVFQNPMLLSEKMYEVKWLMLPGGLLCVCVVFICFIGILCNAGHLKGSAEPAPGVLSDIPLDLLTGVYGAGGILSLYLGYCLMLYYSNWIWRGMIFALGAALFAVWCTLWLQETALRFKLGKWWRNTILYRLCAFLVRTVRGIHRGISTLLESFPAIWPAVLLICALCLFEFLGIVVFRDRSTLAFFWFLEKIVVVPLLVYCAWAFTRLEKKSRQLADGRLEENKNIGGLVFCFKTMDRNLNRIQDGMSKAVEQRMKSERLKTELITNVSHDLKTPLTSIINYADLLGNVAASEESEETQRECLTEYSEVLLRQSARLKKLLEDLIDASKAATGNLEVTLAPMDLGVLFTQIVGEYETKLTDRHLDLRLSGTKQEVWVLADGKFMWRVFDNLLNNICKYAQENSRVYLSMEEKEGQAVITFRNMSKYELNVSSQELTERFVRGDASRHQEGSGLGLSIASSLMELQSGSMQILTDGDLFKATLMLPVINAEQRG